MKTYGIILSAALIFLYISCSNKSDEQPGTGKDRITDTTATVQPVQDTIFKYQVNIPVHYSVYKLRGLASIKILDSMYGRSGRNLILALNRMDNRNIRRGDSIVVPDTILNWLSYSPFPFELSSAHQIPKLLIISKKIQAFAGYENGLLRRWGPTASGRKSKPTPAGLFSLNWKSEETISTIDSSWILPHYFNFHNKEGIALHEFSMPGYPASHACVRLLAGDAKWIYDWAEQWIVSSDGERVIAHGTPLIIYDEYKFGSPPPWKYLPQHPDTLVQERINIDNMIAEKLPILLERKEKRDSVIARRKELKKLAEQQNEATAMKE